MTHDGGVSRPGEDRLLHAACGLELKQLVDPGSTLAQFALSWVIDQPGVSTVIPGARNPEQARQNTPVAGLEPLRQDQLDGVRDV